MLREIRDLGFDYAELSHGIRVSLLPGIFEAVEAGEIRISTLHNFCPLPMGVTHAAPNLYEFSSEKPRDQDLVLRHTLKTIEFAARMKAALVVLHFGSMDLKDYSGKLEEMLARGEKMTPKYDKLCAEAAKAREARKGKFFARSCAVLKKLLPEAEKRQLKFGIERHGQSGGGLLARHRPRPDQGKPGFHQPFRPSRIARRASGRISHP
jgi:sugar phosphate isomerase/epimerase